MEEIIQEALGKGVEMHVAGELDLASELYASVIKLQPNHADANHNMGLLKVDKGQDLEALPYLQTALQADPSIAQFWLSYIRALIKLDKVDEAGRILSLAQESGVKSEEFPELHQQLNGLASVEKEAQSQLDASNQSNLNTGSEAPPQEAINQLANLYNQGQLSAVVEQAQALTEQYPSAFIVWNILGAANKGLGRVGEAVRAFQKVTELNPTYADGFNNLGATLHDQGKAEEAIEAYNRAISLHPNDTKVHYNMGVTLQEHGKLDEALVAYNKAITLKPDYAEAMQNFSELLKIISPKNISGNKLIQIQNRITEKNCKSTYRKSDQELALNILESLKDIKQNSPKLTTSLLQIYKRNGIDLNCERHKKVFNSKRIIPEFCFGCFKVQIDVGSVLDLIRLCGIFYVTELQPDLTTKCLVEVRPDISGSYKGIIFCKSLDQASDVKEKLDSYLVNLDSIAFSSIKRGCSEYYPDFPEYKKIANATQDLMKYPEKWRSLEVEFDNFNWQMPKTFVNPSLRQFGLSDFLIIQRWIDYAKGLGDPTSLLFESLPVEYEDTFKVAQNRKQN